MARVTVEDCITKVRNRFDLVLYSAQRARQISAGAEIKVDRDNDKNPVVALREIAEDKVKPEDLREAIIHSMQRHVEVDEPEEDDLSLLFAGRKAQEKSEGDEELTVESLEAAARELEEGDGASGEGGKASDKGDKDDS